MIRRIGGGLSNTAIAVKGISRQGSIFLQQNSAGKYLISAIAKTVQKGSGNYGRYLG